MSIYTYQLPPELVALTPAVPRDSSRILVYDTTKDEISLDYFYNIYKYLPPDSLLVLNHTYVKPTRITLYKKTGGKVVCLLLLNEDSLVSNQIKVMVDRKIGDAETLFVDSTSRSPFGTVTSHLDGSQFMVELSISSAELDALLESQGKTPIPPYLSQSALSEGDLRSRYQTVFAEKSSSLPFEGTSVAAPTASLHFTERVFTSLNAKNITQVPIRLDVGMGTFAPLQQVHLDSGKLHSERYQVSDSSARLLKSAIERNQQVIGVGTTAVRAVESWIARKQRPGTDTTDIFIRPGYEFQCITGMITNFHIPESSLMMLVQAFLEHKKAPRNISELYKIAIKEKFRFYSFGDAMVIV